MRPFRFVPVLVAAALAVGLYFASTRDALAVPSFARKYQTSCQTCHTVFPVLNPFGEAFRRDGYRFPSQNGSLDSDAIKASVIALGQQEYEKTFPDSVWPDKITEAVPLSIMVNGGVPLNLPGSDAKAAAGNTFTWSGIAAEMHIFGAGSFNDSLTYMTQVTLESNFGAPASTFDIETAYLLWNDIVGPRHLVNLWVGRLWAPQLTSFGLHSDYLADTSMPATSVAGLYSGNSAGFSLGQGHHDGVELNGIAAHRLNYALGWVGSSTAVTSAIPNAEDVYAHIGVKSGGVALDGEGKYGPNVPDPRKPWAERSIVFDLFAYHGLTRFDNGTGAVAALTATPAAHTLQDDRFNAAGAVIHGQWDSLIMMAGVQMERHERPYRGASAASGGVPGVADYASGTGYLQYDEIDYVVWPWLVPGVRAEYTQTTVQGQSDGQLLRLIPGIAMLARPNIKVILSGDLEWGKNLPVVGTWGAAGGALVPTGADAKFQAETINAAVAVAY